MAKLFNLARMTTATTGTGTITLGSAVSGCLTFAQAGVSNSDVVDYAIKDGSNSEIGTGTYTSSGTTLTRTVTKSTNSNAAISLSGAAEVFISPRAETLVDAASLTSGVLNPARINIAGTVSGNPPTGAIIERGSNASGNWVRYADGTQIAWRTATVALTYTAVGYPIAFFGNAFVSAVADGASSIVATGVGGVSSAQVNVAVTGGSNQNIQLIMIGRWF